MAVVDRTLEKSQERMPGRACMGQSAPARQLQGAAGSGRRLTVRFAEVPRVPAALEPFASASAHGTGSSNLARPRARARTASALGPAPGALRDLRVQAGQGDRVVGERLRVPGEQALQIRLGSGHHSGGMSSAVACKRSAPSRMRRMTARHRSPRSCSITSIPRRLLGTQPRAAMAAGTGTGAPWQAYVART